MRAGARCLVTSTVAALLVLSGLGCADEDNIGSGSVAELVAPESIVFSETPLETTQTRSVILSNGGSAPLEIRKLAIKESDEDELTELSPGEKWFSSATLKPNEQRKLMVAFSPKNTNPLSGNLVISSNALNAGENGKLRVDIITPDLGPQIASPSVVRFSGVAPGNQASKTIQVQNTGSAPLVFNDLFLASDSSPDFSLSFPGRTVEEGQLTVQQLAPRSSFPVNVSFAPTGASPATNEIVFATNASNGSEYKVELRGNSNTACLDTSLEDPVDHGEADMGDTTVKIHTVTNCSSENDLKVKDISIPDDDGGVFSLQNQPTQLPKTIGPEETIRFTTVFSPDEAGSCSGQLKLTSNDPVQSERTYELTGDAPADGVRDCGNSNIKRVDNLDDVRPQQTESNCTIYVFQERSNVTDKQVDVEVTQLTNGTKGYGAETVSETFNSYYIHYDKLGQSRQHEKTQGTIQFDNEILGVIYTADGLSRTHRQIGVCNRTTGPSCGSGSTRYPVHPPAPDMFDTEDGDMTRSAIVGPKTLQLDFKSNISADQMRVLTKGEPEDSVKDCGDDSVVRVDNISDMRPNKVESDCKIKVFPEKKNHSHGPLDVEYTQLPKGAKGSDPKTINTDQQPVNVYGVHYDKEGSENERKESASGIARFDNEIIGIVYSVQGLFKTNKQLGICDSIGPNDQICSSSNTIYPIEGRFTNHRWGYGTDQGMASRAKSSIGRRF